MSEFDLIRWIRDRATTGDRVVQGIGDDCASISQRDGYEFLMTTDMLMDGRHFQRETASPREIGYKTLAVNLSDIAAMAGLPVAAVVAVALPRQGATDLAHEIHAGMAPLAQKFGVSLIGGDTNAWDGPLVLCVTVLGEVEAGQAVKRSGARVGDAIYVTGPLGGSLLGRHLCPEPRILEARSLRETMPIHAMIDLSDGLSSDLGHILEESGGLGAILDASQIPIHPDAVAMSEQDRLAVLHHALGDGEDYELCFTAPPAAIAPAGIPIYRIGFVTSEPGLLLRELDGSLNRPVSSGFDHLRNS